MPARSLYRAAQRKSVPCVALAAGATAHKIRARGQSQDREIAWCGRPAEPACHHRRGHRIKPRMSVRGQTRRDHVDGMSAIAPIATELLRYGNGCFGAIRRREHQQIATSRLALPCDRSTLFALDLPAAIMRT
jgi:hypothetical protein